MILSIFPCTRCGLCCRNVHLAEETRHLDRGDGVCMHYSDLDKLCTIYDNRPSICNVKQQYKLHYSQRYSWLEFAEENIKICNLLQECSGKL